VCVCVCLQTAVRANIQQSKRIVCELPWQEKCQISTLNSILVHVKCTSNMMACYDATRHAPHVFNKANGR